MVVIDLERLRGDGVSSVSMRVESTGGRRYVDVDEDASVSDSEGLTALVAEDVVRPFSFCWFVFNNFRRGVFTMEDATSSGAGRFGV